ncbi:hypothetical protein COCCADRAFT_107297 [Bipolaris zeicola 26-R-13]|uniref:Uncharacterized protein n=1 Tax=Cochliobolus carbonum (strain 26-R-13) TaxID=930089 RepID=W6XP82_COCC2|nr:uncharacterized protein COCCADRAFT_107297 [Bipolaris zeicola 26-R-13]EUC29147.1 hypothetical protein COCCADRAFT_107297 [Bipolaris zeicola 26-R-13]
MNSYSTIGVLPVVRLLTLHKSKLSSHSCLRGAYHPLELPTTGQPAPGLPSKGLCDTGSICEPLYYTLAGTQQVHSPCGENNLCCSDQSVS